MASVYVNLLTSLLSMVRTQTLTSNLHLPIRRSTVCVTLELHLILVKTIHLSLTLIKIPH